MLLCSLGLLCLVVASWYVLFYNCNSSWSHKLTGNLDSPTRAKCFTEEDKTLMIERVRTNQTSIQNKTFRPERIKEALLDLRSGAIVVLQSYHTPGLRPRGICKHHHLRLPLHCTADTVTRDGSWSRDHYHPP